jgi:ATP-dependent protease ClpP protease subunit
MLKPIPLPQAPRSTRRSYFARATGRAFEMHAQAGVTEIDLYDEIGFFGITAKAFKERLRGAGDVRLRINSPGGDVFEGIAIYNDLVAHQRTGKGRVEVEIVALAASAASIIAMAGERISMAKNAFLMIHNAWALTIGDRHTHEAMSGVLGQIDQALAQTYADRTGQKLAPIQTMMDDETWLSAEQAVEEGFADETLDPVEASAQYDLSAFAHPPPTLAAAKEWMADESLTKRDLERALREAGYSIQQAKAIAAKAFGATDLREVDRVRAVEAQSQAVPPMVLRELSPLLTRSVA